MNKLLILYPALFTCQTKFDRKVGNIVSRLSSFSVVFPIDPHGYIEEFFERRTSKVELRLNEAWRDVGDVSHAIIFDDGEEFVEDTQWVEANEIQLRLIKIPLARVVNIRSETKYADLKSTPRYEYIGRGSYWGNPYSMYEEGESREEVISKYQYDFDRDIFPNKEKSKVLKLLGKRLGCFCKPDACHGDVLANYLNGYDDGK